MVVWVCLVTNVVFSFCLCHAMLPPNLVAADEGWYTRNVPPNLPSSFLIPDSILACALLLGVFEAGRFDIADYPLMPVHICKQAQSIISTLIILCLFSRTPQGRKLFIYLLRCFSAPRGRGAKAYCSMERFSRTPPHHPTPRGTSCRVF